MPQKRSRGRTIAIVAGSLVAVLVILAIIGAVAGKKTNNPPNPGTAVAVTNGANTPAGYTTFENATEHFSIAIPKTWKSIDPTSPGAQAAMNEIQQSSPNLKSAFAGSAAQLAERGMGLLAINPSIASDGIAPNLNIIAQPDLTYTPSDLDKIAASLPAEYQKLKARLTGISYTTLDGQRALHATDILPVTSPLGVTAQVAEAQYIVGANNFLYIITVTDNDPAFATILSTFSTA